MKRLLFIVAALSLCVGASAAVPTSATPKTVWKVALPKSTKIGRGVYQHGKPAVSERVVYAGSATGGVYAVHEASGKRVWHVETAGPVYAPVSLSEYSVFAVDAKGYVYAFDRPSGELRWKTPLQVELMAAPLVYGDYIYVSTQRGELVALHSVSGQVYWRTPQRVVSARFAVRGASDPVLIGKRIIVGFADGRIVAFALRNGETLWEQRIAPRNAVLQDVDTTIVPYRNRFLVAAVEGGLSLRNPKHGLPVWRSKLASPNDLVVEGDVAYVTGRGALSAVDLKNGRTLWQRALDNTELNAPIVVDDYVLASSTSNQLYVVSREDGSLVGQRYLSGGTNGDFTRVGAQLFVLSNANQLVSLRMPEKSQR